ncbi:MAG: 3-dehydroquinate synthase [Muribaculaceae bacterium]|nr:3-dehydroquinate synthase [Muribaculaceae bacterium]
MQRLIFTDDPRTEVAALVAMMNPDRVFTVADSNTAMLMAVEGAELIVIPPGDACKGLASVQKVWEALVRGGATRRSLIVNLGGGMVTDLGGFAASTFKRGVRFVNVPTTLLGAVDAAVGGKTGINFMGLKNEIGAFREADAVVVSARFFGTLPPQELMSGYAEMVKHALIADADEYGRLLAADPLEIGAGEMLELLRRSIEVKRRIVAEDPCEKGVRKALNLGHTFGHAFEELALEKGEPAEHGRAVAHGLLAEMVVAHMTLGFPSAELQRYAAWLRSHYHPMSVVCGDYPRMLELMAHDKKNSEAGAVNFSLLREPGAVKTDCTASSDTITAALDIYRDLIC